MNLEDHASVPFFLSNRAGRTADQPIGFLIATAFANPHIISLAAGLVDYETLPSALSDNDFRVNRFQFDACIADFELPVHAALVGVAVLVPRGCF